MHRNDIVILLGLVAVGAMAGMPRAVPRAAPGRSDLRAVWVQLGPDGVALARALTIADSCPSIALDGQIQPMLLRAAPDGADFPERVCEAQIPPGTLVATVDGQAVPVPRPNPRRILVLGDTGCRLKAGDGFQACDDPQAWPFATLAATAAAWPPDLVLFVGDILYREQSCPQGNAGCEGSPSGYNWPANDADFFTPAAPLLRAAPWVVVRGDHELCTRNGAAWFRYFEPRPMPAACQDYTDPYAVPLGGLQLLVLDTSLVDDDQQIPAQASAYAAQFDEVAGMAGPSAWLLLHQPMWGFGRLGAAAPSDPVKVENLTLQTASGNALPPGVQLILSGHEHLFEALSFADGRAPQLVLGNGGTLLAPVTASLVGAPVAGTTVSAATVLNQFGFLTLEPAVGGWTGTVRDPGGAILASCTVQQRSVVCAE